MFWFRRDPDARLGVGVAFTTAALDLGDGRERQARDADLARLSAALGVPVAIVAQVHGADVCEVGATEATTVVDLTAQQADALVTTEPGVALAVRVADCVPVLFADAGRPGLRMRCDQPGPGRVEGRRRPAPADGLQGGHACRDAVMARF